MYGFVISGFAKAFLVLTEPLSSPYFGPLDSLLDMDGVVGPSLISYRQKMRLLGPYTWLNRQKKKKQKQKKERLERSKRTQLSSIISDLLMPDRAQPAKPAYIT